MTFNSYFPRPSTPKTPPAVLPPVWEGARGYADGPGGSALFNAPEGVAVDAFGNVYVADTSNNLIRKITPVGTVTTLAGLDGKPGTADGKGSLARFNSPRGIAVDRLGQLYIADTLNNRIRKITLKGGVTTLAGSGARGSDNGRGAEAAFNNPTGVAVDVPGNVYVADEGNNLIRKITVDGRVSTWAGSGLQGHANGKGIDASFAHPLGVAADSGGNVYIADEVSEQVRKIDREDEVTTLAGQAGKTGSTDGKGADVLFCYPGGITADLKGNLYITDRGTNLIRKMNEGGRVTTMAGSGSVGFADGKGASALFHHPSGIAVDASGNVYIADQENCMIRKVTPQGEVTTLAGGGAVRPTADQRMPQGSKHNP